MASEPRAAAMFSAENNGGLAGLPRAVGRTASVCCCFLLCAAGPALGQTADPPADDAKIHWAFASLAGTGWYRVTSDQRAFVVNIPPRQQIRASGWSGSGERQIGVSISYDAAVGLHSLDDPQEIIRRQNISTVSFTPGVELEIPVNRSWYLRPYANFGRGAAIDSGESAWIYYAGIKSRYEWDRGRHRWALFNGVSYAGFKPNTGKSQDLTGLYAGIELSHPWQGGKSSQDSFDLHWLFGYTLLNDPAEFSLGEDGLRSIGNPLEIGFAVSRPDRPFRFWFVEFERLGLSVSFDTDGTFSAITFQSRSWFNK